MHYWPGIRIYKLIRVLTHAQAHWRCSFAVGAVLMLKILVRCRSRHRRFRIITQSILRIHSSENVSVFRRTLYSQTLYLL